MCGIFGILSVNHISECEGLVNMMGNSLFHRGPDDEGYYIDQNMILGHRRLSIIDLDSGGQPMFNEKKTIAIVFNGEIYNYRDLRIILKNKGHEIRTKSDTEVIIHLYEEYGEDCLHHLSGMFAFALWDSERRILFIARDRFGIKPMNFHNNGNMLIFSSEIRTIMMSKSIHKILSWKALRTYLAFNYIPAPFTIYDDIYKLEPGHFIIARLNEDNKNIVIEKTRWYDIANITTNYSTKYFTEAKHVLKDVLESTVLEHMVSDVPYGAFLSGGIDSSIIVGLMAKLSSQKVKTFTVGYEGNNIFDESLYARAVASHFNTDHNEIYLNHKDVLNIIPDVLDNLNEPFADWSIFPTYVISRETKKRVKVVLSGDGADEIFGGYRKYLGEMLARYYLLIPKSIRSNVFTPLANSLPASYQNLAYEWFRRVKKFINGMSEYPEERHYRWMQCLTDEQQLKLLKQFSVIDQFNPSLMIKDLYNSYEGDYINKMLYVDMMFCLPNDMLAKVDSMSMLNSLEVRVPYLDHKVVEYSFSLEGRYKLSGTRRKYLLIESFKDLLPKVLHNRPKKGFDVPIGEWFKRELKELFWDIVSEDRIKEYQIFNYDYIKNMYDLHVQSKVDFSKQLTNIFIFQWWLHRNNPQL